MRTVDRPRLAAPLAVAGASVATFAVLRLRDPHTEPYLSCPFRAVTGLWCPLCGGLRAAADLTHGAVAASLSSNMLVVPTVVVAVFAWLAWVSGRRVQPHRAALWTVAALVVAFTLVRNTGWGAWFAP